MGLVNKAALSAPQPISPSVQPGMYNENGYIHPQALLNDTNEAVRRKAIKAMRHKPQQVNLLLEQLSKERSIPVVEAIIDSLMHHCQDKEIAADVVTTILPILTELSANTRNSAILFLSTLPGEMKRHIPGLLSDNNKDVQLYALDILRSMNHPDTPVWLGDMLKQNLHVNVLISLLDRIADFQAMDLIEPVKHLSEQSNEPLVTFSAKLTLQRLGGECEYA